jgi:putative intracellular protease/amidase
MKILMVLTSHDKLGETGLKTGYWLDEFAGPYYAFKDAGVAITLASPLGGAPPMDPKSDLPESATAATKRFKTDRVAQAILADTRKLPDLKAEDYDGMFYPGGHGPLWDLAQDPSSIALIEAMLGAGKPVAAVCHGPAVLLRPRAADGTLLLKDRAVTGFSNTEESALGLARDVPFLLENMLVKAGGRYSKAADWQPNVVVDGLIITGQNPASAGPVARALLAKVGSTAQLAHS